MIVVDLVCALAFSVFIAIIFKSVLTKFKVACNEYENDIELSIKGKEIIISQLEYEISDVFKQMKEYTKKSDDILSKEIEFISRSYEDILNSWRNDHKYRIFALGRYFDSLEEQLMKKRLLDSVYENLLNREFSIDDVVFKFAKSLKK
ncbi:hypothetical protein [Candidatus Gromoviella agglomerans]|uniref:hypothetical protein n=1 Tax=Candidatus Gromoviella agglomerans TaxID=2806609 RepID=UPI001E2C9036|nr:hypothetical protein [Candidatus Gromoviella agglomerans]UFX98422.1 hypothetical protein Gromo_00325 [Candidatus Gromoviella agglomerans]